MELHILNGEGQGHPSRSKVKKSIKKNQSGDKGALCF